MGRILFRNVNLLDGESPARKSATVIVEDERIAAGTDGAAQNLQGDTNVDLGGLTMMPGMVAGHFHATYRNGGGLGSSLSNPSAASLSYLALSNAQTALRCGFTSVVSASTFFDIDPALTGAIENGFVDGPRYIPASRFLIPAEEEFATPYRDFCVGPESFAKAAERAIAEGAKIVKLIVTGKGHIGAGFQRDMTEDELRAVVEVARAHGVRTRGHITKRETTLFCARLGVDIIDHADGMDDECIEVFLEHGSFVLPTLYFPFLCKHGLAQDKYSEGFDSANFDKMVETLPKAAAAGVKLVTGDDFGVIDLPHGTYAREMACYVQEVGLSPLEVIKWATRNGGELTGIADLGTIAPGKLADLLIVDGDPSADISILADPERIVAVMKGGKVMAGRLPATSEANRSMVA